MMILNPYRYAAAGGATDPNFANVSSLLHFDGVDTSTTFTDQTGKTWTATGSAQIDTAQSKFGGASCVFSGSSDYITTPSHTDFDFGSGDFTVECWARLNLYANNQGIICRDQIGGTRGWLLYVANSTNKLTFAAWNGATAYTVVDTVAFSTGGSFKHIAAVRDGGTLRLYKDGVQVASTAIAVSVGAPAEPCVMGTLWATGSPQATSDFNGWIDDARITKGVCRYPSGTTFTPATAAFPDS